ncbi:MAG: maltotransferase domain-containing protein [Candidatus Rokuibacteriota bacterium]
MPGDPADPRRTVVIENIAPAVDGGRYPVKREVGDVVEVAADIFKDGHDVLVAFLRYRPASATRWRESPMRFVDNDRWAGRFPLDAPGRWLFTIEALPDPFHSWLADLDKRVAAGQDVGSELLEGAALVAEAGRRAQGADAEALGAWARRIGHRDGLAEAVAAAREPALADLMGRHLDRREATPAERAFEVVADRERARFAAWYEFFPRSGSVDRHGTFKNAEAQLERAAAMGFDVVYLPPIHPVGRTHRKGRNNTLIAQPGDPGSVWAIGAAEGGHTAVHPELGTLEDFARFVERARALGLEVALDFAIQCSPDHPWVREHPEWFFHRPDGTIKYAENPPKKYHDVYPLNFNCADPRPLWEEMRRTLEHWIGHGVRTFRVDNPHTKPVRFWEWLIRAIQDRHPDVIFLAEAFTRPTMMKVLAKAGFTQSYTYFTWRNDKQELIDYLTEITRPPVADYFRGHLWPNTPDILHATLQKGGRPAFRMRLVLAATLSSLYGIYSGYELGENLPYAEGSEEYLNSEKYELKARDWHAPGNLGDLVTTLNRLRREHRALQGYTNLRFHPADDPHVLFYGKADGADVVLVAVNLDPYAPHSAWAEVPLHELGIAADATYRLHERLTDTWQDVRGPRLRLSLDPAREPAAIFSLHRA